MAVTENQQAIPETASMGGAHVEIVKLKRVKVKKVKAAKAKKAKKVKAAKAKKAKKAQVKKASGDGARSSSRGDPTVRVFGAPPTPTKGFRAAAIDVWDWVKREVSEWASSQGLDRTEAASALLMTGIVRKRALADHARKLAVKRGKKARRK